ELSRTHSISYMGRPTAGWGSINCAGAGQPGRVWQARTAPGVAMLPGEAGINVRKTARYASKDCDPLHKRGADTMGMKHRVDDGVYVFYGSMNPQLAEKTGFSDEDAEAIKRVLPKLFENDASSARPEGSMEVLKVIWWKHGSKCGRHSSAKVHRTLSVKPDGEITVASLDGLQPEIIEGF